MLAVLQELQNIIKEGNEKSYRKGNSPDGKEKLSLRLLQLLSG
jgi:hypothetical protein